MGEFNTKVIVKQLSNDVILKNMDKDPGRCAYLHWGEMGRLVEKNKFIIGKEYQALIKVNEWGEWYSEDISVLDEDGKEQILSDIFFNVKRI